jgi:glycosyltransferase involved in cell wall biosynthesis
MKVLFITSYYHPAIEYGGPAKSVPALAMGLKKLGIDLTVVTTNARGLPDLPKVPRGLKEVNSVPVYYFARIGPARYFLSFGMLIYLFKYLYTFDIIHIHGVWGFPALLGSRLSQIRRKPYLITLRGELVQWAMSQKSIKKLLYMTLFGEKTLTQSIRIHFTSEVEKRNSIKKFPDHKSVVIPNPVDIEKFLRLEPLPNKGSGKEKIVLSIIGRLHPVKGFELLLPALSTLRNACDFELLIVGPDEGSYLTKIKQMVDSLYLTDQVKYLGLLQGDLLVEAYEKSDIIVVSSYQENFGMSAAEGMASARPVIVSNKVGIADIVEKYRAGWVFEPSIDSLANLLKTVVNQPGLLRSYGLNGRKAAAENFTDTAVAKKFLEVYDEILKQRSNRGITIKEQPDAGQGQIGT